jgi:hypothetical protein
MHLGSHRKVPLEFLSEPPFRGYVQNSYSARISYDPGLESLFRENGTELEHPLWAKRRAARASVVWPKGVILVRRGSPFGTNGALSRGLAWLLRVLF